MYEDRRKKKYGVNKNESKKTSWKPTSSNKRKKTQKPSQRGRKRIQVDDAADSDEDWCVDDGGRKTRKRRCRPHGQRKRMRFGRVQPSSDSESDWLSEFLSDSEPESAARKPKVKPVEYKLSDEDFRTNYAFLLNDDKLLEDPVVKLVVLDIDGPSVILKDESKESVKVKIEPVDTEVEVHRSQPEVQEQTLGVVVKTEPPDELDLPMQVPPVEKESGNPEFMNADVEKSNCAVVENTICTDVENSKFAAGENPMHADVENSMHANVDKTTVEIFTGGERTVVEAIVEFAGNFEELPGEYGETPTLPNKDMANTEETQEKDKIKENELSTTTEVAVSESATAKKSIIKDPVSINTEIKQEIQEPVVKREPIDEFNTPPFQFERKTRSRTKQVEQPGTKPSASDLGRKMRSVHHVKNASSRRHRWTDKELRVYHSHLNSDPLLARKPVVELEILKFLDSPL